MTRREKEKPKKTPPAARKYVKNVTGLTLNQNTCIEELEENTIVFFIGPPGTGKSYIALSKALEHLERGLIKKIVLTRPAIEAGENLGFLPGTMEEKLGPYLRPMYDIIVTRIGLARMKALLAEEIIEIAPLAFMRGRSLDDCFIILDEAQNCTAGQLKMVLTRLGKNSKMVINGDPEQTDVPNNHGVLRDVANKLDNIPGISTVELYPEDIVRSELISKILEVL